MHDNMRDTERAAARRAGRKKSHPSHRVEALPLSGEITRAAQRMEEQGEGEGVRRKADTKDTQARSSFGRDERENKRPTHLLLAKNKRRLASCIGGRWGRGRSVRRPRLSPRNSRSGALALGRWGGSPSGGGGDGGPSFRLCKGGTDEHR